MSDTKLSPLERLALLRQQQSEPVAEADPMAVDDDVVTHDDSVQDDSTRAETIDAEDVVEAFASEETEAFASEEVDVFASDDVEVFCGLEDEPECLTGDAEDDRLAATEEIALNDEALDPEETLDGEEARGHDDQPFVVDASEDVGVEDVDMSAVEIEAADVLSTPVDVEDSAPTEELVDGEEKDDEPEQCEEEFVASEAETTEDVTLVEEDAVEVTEDEQSETPAEEVETSLLGDLLSTPVEDLAFDFSDLGDNGDHAETEDVDADDISEVNEADASTEELAATSPEEPTGEDTSPEHEEPRYIKTGRGGVKKVGGSGSHLDDLFARVNDLLGDVEDETDAPWKPQAPETLRDTGLTAEDVERIALKFLLSKGSASGRQIAGQLKLPFTILEPLLKDWKQAQLIGFKNAAEMGDYIYVITDQGRDKARAYMAESTYFGSAPVQLTDYLKAMEMQSIAKQHATEEDLKRAFNDLLISPTMLDRLGPAVNSGRGMFLFGEPGNGKTSIAERITSCFGSTIWIPRALGIDGDIIRLFDPGVHEAVDWDDNVSHATGGLFDVSGADARWVRITRPTVVAGGELTMDELEVTQNPQTKVCEAPLQLKSNCGTLVIDDFGRQTMPVDVLLNRWIVPLEKRYDFLNLPSGKKIQVPFDQLIVFSTNLEPKDLVDGAFLRRIPYKIEVPDPLPEHFRQLFHIMAPTMGLRVDDESIEYLIREHFEKPGRPFRACLPRDLLLQVRNYCLYKSLPKVMTPDAFDFAVANYFSVM